MNKLTLFAGIACIVTMFALSCKHEPEELPGVTNNNNGNVVTGGEQICNVDTVYFQNKVLPLLISNCAKSDCHDAISHQDDIQLTSYLTIMNTVDVDPGDPNGSELYKVLNETDPNKIMPPPPSTPLTAAEKNIIYTWILQGAKNNACNDCDTTTITYSGAMLPIINTHCKGCHNPAFLSAGLDLTAYANVSNIAQNGKLMGTINHVTGYPAMPRGANKLNDCRITQIRNWIAAGAQNN